MGKQYKYNQMPDNDFTKLLRDAYNALADAGIEYNSVFWNGAKKEFWVKSDSSILPLNDLLASKGFPSIE